MPRFEEVARRKREQRDACIPQEWRLEKLPPLSQHSVMEIPHTCGILTKEELDITEGYDATELAKAIKDENFTSLQVTTAFCKRAAIAQQVTNCLTEIFFDVALRRAANLDHYQKKHGKTMGPLHGVPVSVKDGFRVTGFDSSLGLAALCFKPSRTNSPLVSILLSAGAVLYCKTNIPQTLMALDSDNNIFGRVLNPLNRQVTAGGSSGGEGALVGFKGSVLGVGTDIGGSIRIPAMCNSVYGVKPSANRVPYAGQESGGRPGIGSIGVESSAGPIARSLRDCELFLKTIAAAQPWMIDPNVVPGTWDSMDLSISPSTPWLQPLTIGIMHTDGLINPLPPIKNLLKEVAGKLRHGGIRVLDIPTPPIFKDAQGLANALFGIEGGNEMLDKLESFEEPLIKWLQPSMRRKKAKTLEQIRSMKVQRERMMTEMLSIWRQSDGKGGTADIDALICPVAPHPVPLLDSWGGVSYTANWVLLDCAAGTIPVRPLDETEIQQEIQENLPLSSWDERNQSLWDKSKVDRRVYIGTPLCIQVVGPRLQEKRLLRAMDGIDRILHPKPREGRDAKL